ncbi:MAG: class I SAM-dependent methyltransferase [Acidimicrobiia bacterium]|nr:class I SAM-dependent methyltransferase [Acidimicrobiia bacterium]
MTGAAQLKNHGGSVRLRAGWSKTTLTAGPGPILDVGSGAFPHPHASVICERNLDDNTDRHGASAVIDDRLVVGDATSLPFRDGAFALVIVSHVAEHVEDPVALCRELQRVAHSGYIETPSALAETLLPEPFHQWKVSRRGRRLVFARKSVSSKRLEWTSRHLYRWFYIGQEDRGRPVVSLPPGAAGMIVARMRWVIVGVLNRTHVLHTRMVFSAADPFDAVVVDDQSRRSSEVLAN